MKLEAYIKKLDVSKLKLKNGKTVAQELKHHTEVLADCIQRRLDEVYASYSPRMYIRTHQLQNSVFICPGVQIEVSSKGTTLSTKITFQNGSVHEGFGSYGADTAYLLNEGWQTSGQFKSVPYLGFREGTHFIELAIEDYKNMMPDAFPVKVTKTY